MSKQDDLLLEQKIKDTLSKTRVIENNISTEMRSSFMDYAMSVIVSRALPDARDGLKPVHRRILFAMNELGFKPESAYKKSARVVGEVIGKYHPHGDTAVYESMVRMAQDFSFRYELVDGHGNFGSVDGDSAAAMRYTEARMTKIASELLRDIDSNTVPFVDNYDGSEREPFVLPARFPNLLVNGTTGIAVGMATNIPPHNISEVIDGLIAYSNNPEITCTELMEHIKGPDFPTKGQILGTDGIISAYETGKGIINVRAKSDIEYHESGKATIIISEIPFMVNKSVLIEKIADLVKDKFIEGISDLRDESNRDGIRIVIETKKDAVAEVVLNKLHKLTQLQTSFGINILALVNGEPKVLPLKETLRVYLAHQIDVNTRKAKFDLDKALARKHLLDGLKIALNNIDEIIEIIKKAKTSDDAAKVLEKKFSFSEIQSKAILEMRLNRLTGLEKDKIEAELNELTITVNELNSLLQSKEKMIKAIQDDLMRIKDKFGDKRRTEILYGMSSNIDDESLIPQQDIVITISKRGYVKRMPLTEYRNQKRGGVGVQGVTTYEEDDVDSLIVSHTHRDLLFFTTFGKVYRIRGHQVPQFGRQAKGIPAINLLNIEKTEEIASLISVVEYKEGEYLLFCTRNGLVKRTPTLDFESIRQNGKIAITLEEGDALLDVKVTNNTAEIIIGANNGKAVHFMEEEIRISGRTAIGVYGINIRDDEKDTKVVGIATSLEGKYILSIGKNGYGKMTEMSEYRLTSRGAKGVITIKDSNKTGKLVSVKAVQGNEDLLVMTTEGVIIRFSIAQIRQTGRNAVGVKLINLKDDNKVKSISIVEHDENAIITQVIDAEVLDAAIEAEESKI